MVDRRKRLEADDLVWMIHQELLKRIGKGRSFTIAVAPQKGGGWVVRQPAGGRSVFPEVQAAIEDVEREFQALYRLKRSAAKLDDEET